jgi:deoxyribose-phosphate aldolase
MIANDIAQFIDHTLLKPETTPSQIEALCAEAAKFQFKAVCIHPVHVLRASEMLRETAVLIATVVGFPLGANRTETKSLEATLGVRDGAHEIDMVADLGAIKNQDLQRVEQDIAQVVRNVPTAVVKVILETASLTPAEIRDACKAAENAGAHFVKTSTGFGRGGATLDAVRLMRACVSPKVQVKASGGIRTKEDAWAYIEAGASRIGTSAGVSMVMNLELQTNEY